MKIDPTITTGSILLAIGLLITGTGLLLNFLQLLRSWRVQKAQFLSNITKDLFDEGDLRRFFYKIDYEKFVFDPEALDSFKGSDNERYLDSLLYRYNHLGSLVRMKILEIGEIEFLIFEIVQVFKNKEVDKYISWLESEYKKHGSIGSNSRKRPYDDARWLIERLSRQTQVCE